VLQTQTAPPDRFPHGQRVSQEINPDLVLLVFKQSFYKFPRPHVIPEKRSRFFREFKMSADLIG
jgi:hypothetical protein